MIEARMDRLFREQDGKCHWCSRQTQRAPLKKGRPTPGNQATIDHVYLRDDARRHGDAGNPLTICHVLACYNCNNERGDKPYNLFLMLKKPEWREAIA